jgi:hypothetical protein
MTARIGVRGPGPCLTLRSDWRRSFRVDLSARVRDRPVDRRGETSRRLFPLCARLDGRHPGERDPSPSGSSKRRRRSRPSGPTRSPSMPTGGAEPPPITDVAAIQALGRKIAPFEPGSVAWSSSSRMATLYDAVKRRRVGRSLTSGSGFVSIGQGCTAGRRCAAAIATSGSYVPALVQ